MEIARRSARRSLAVVSLVAAALLSGSAVAQDIATAEALFREGRELMSQGKTKEACEKFAASQKIDPSSGTLLNLADCHYKEGKVATAWAEFLAAARLARTQGNQGRADEATRRASELEKSLSYMTLAFTEKPNGAQVKRDDEVLEDAVLSSKIPVDPGPHVITVTAPGYELWSQTVVVTPGETKALTIPALKRSAATPAASASAKPGSAPTASTGAPPPPSPPSGSSMKTAGYVVGGVGIAALAVGGFFGLRAASTYKDAKDACGGNTTSCPPDAMDKRKTAGNDATIANVGVGLGVVGVGVGVALLLMAKPSQESAAFVVAPSVAPNGAGASIAGRF